MTEAALPKINTHPRASKTKNGVVKVRTTRRKTPAIQPQAVEPPKTPEPKPVPEDKPIENVVKPAKKKIGGVPATPEDKPIDNVVKPQPAVKKAKKPSSVVQPAPKPEVQKKTKVVPRVIPDQGTQSPTPKKSVKQKLDQPPSLNDNSVAQKPVQKRVKKVTPTAPEPKVEKPKKAPVQKKVKTVKQEKPDTPDVDKKKIEIVYPKGYEPKKADQQPENIDKTVPKVKTKIAPPKLGKPANDDDKSAPKMAQDSLRIHKKSEQPAPQRQERRPQPNPKLAGEQHLVDKNGKKIVRIRTNYDPDLDKRLAKWWDSLTDKQKRSYIRLHPRSKYAKEYRQSVRGKGVLQVPETRRYALPTDHINKVKRIKRSTMLKRKLKKLFGKLRNDPKTRTELAEKSQEHVADQVSKRINKEHPVDAKEIREDVEKSANTGVPLTHKAKHFIARAALSALLIGGAVVLGGIGGPHAVLHAKHEMGTAIDWAEHHIKAERDFMESKKNELIDQHKKLVKQQQSREKQQKLAQETKNKDAQRAVEDHKKAQIERKPEQDTEKAQIDRDHVKEIRHQMLSNFDGNGENGLLNKYVHYVLEYYKQHGFQQSSDKPSEG